jgi:hypothetical protein
MMDDGIPFVEDFLNTIQQIIKLIERIEHHQFGCQRPTSEHSRGTARSSVSHGWIVLNTQAKTSRHCTVIMFSV